jgi:hypothetical protein
MADKQKLNYRFHNPNPPQNTADFVLGIFLAVNKYKLDQALQKAAAKCSIDLKHCNNKK